MGRRPRRSSDSKTPRAASPSETRHRSSTSSTTSLVSSSRLPSPGKLILGVGCQEGHKVQRPGAQVRVAEIVHSWRISPSSRNRVRWHGGRQRPARRPRRLKRDYCCRNRPCHWAAGLARQPDHESRRFPRRRGEHHGKRAEFDSSGVIPAGAGSIAPGRSQPRSAGGHPRGRGEHADQDDKGQGMEGSSPRARGASQRSRHKRSISGVIPAGAGSMLLDLGLYALGVPFSSTFTETGIQLISILPTAADGRQTSPQWSNAQNLWIGPGRTYLPW